MGGENNGLMRKAKGTAAFPPTTYTTTRHLVVTSLVQLSMDRNFKRQGCHYSVVFISRSTPKGPVVYSWWLLAQKNLLSKGEGDTELSGHTQHLNKTESMDFQCYRSTYIFCLHSYMSIQSQINTVCVEYRKVLSEPRCELFRFKFKIWFQNCKKISLHVTVLLKYVKAYR